MTAGGMRLAETLIAGDAIQARVAELGREVSEQYRGIERPLVLIGILKGSVIFAADLARAISVDVEFEFVGCRSYGESTTTSGTVEFTKDIGMPLRDRDVLVVEDIVDTGLTTSFVLEHVKTHSPASARLVALLDKEGRRIREVKPDFCGFNIPNEFVVGYGLDFGERYRNLPDVRILREAP